MTPKFINEIREAMQQQSGRPLEIPDDQMNTAYIVMTREQFQKLVYDDSDLTPEEMVAATATGLDDAEGWGAPGMEVYDEDHPQAPSS